MFQCSLHHSSLLRHIQIGLLLNSFHDWCRFLHDIVKRSNEAKMVDRKRKYWELVPSFLFLRMFLRYSSDYIMFCGLSFTKIGSTLCEFIFLGDTIGKVVACVFFHHVSHGIKGNFKIEVFSYQIDRMYKGFCCWFFLNFLQLETDRIW